MRTLFMTAFIMTTTLVPALAASGTTVNSFSPAQDARDRKAIVEAGYKPAVLEFAQDGNLFYTATKGGDMYGVTVVPSGHVYASTGLPEKNSGAPAG
jgi:hypothetical protein